MAIFVIVEFCGGLIREEVPLLSLKVLLEFWSGKSKYNTRHVMMTLRRRFKRWVGDICHLLLILYHTKSVIPVRKFCCWGLKWHGLIEGRQSGWYWGTDNGGRVNSALANQISKHILVIKIGTSKSDLWEGGRRELYSL